MPVRRRAEARGKRDQIAKGKTKAKVKKRKPRSKAKDSKERKAKRQAKNQEEAIKRARKEGLKTTTQQPDTLRTPGSVPEPQLGDPKRQEGPGVTALATPAVPPAADCGTAPPCGGPLYGGPAMALTFGLLPKQPTDSALSVDIGGVERNAPPVAFFTERSLAAYLAVSDRTIRNWIRRGELPSYKLGAARRIDPADVEAFLAQRRDEVA